MTCGLAAVVMVGLGGVAAASSPAGVWSEPKVVTITGADGATPEVVIEGLFSVWTGSGPIGGDWGMQGYQDAQWGLMYYRCAEADKALCLMQWGDIDDATKNEGCVGWGNQDDFAGTVRAAGVAPTSPDAWVVDAGVNTGFTPCQYLAGIAPPEVEPGAETVAEPVVEASPEPVVEASPEPVVEASPEPVVEAGAETSEPATDTSVPPTKVDDSSCAGSSRSGLGLLPGLAAALAALALGRRGARRER
ncbi:MAG: hypothetical protein U1F43_01035 [Myxococcota bacterium]